MPSNNKKKHYAPPSGVSHEMNPDTYNLELGHHHPVHTNHQNKQATQSLPIGFGVSALKW